MPKSSDVNYTADMPKEVIEDALQLMLQAFEANSQENVVATTLKREFVKKYRGVWHCVVGKNFGSFVTHEMKGNTIIEKGDTSDYSRGMPMLPFAYRETIESTYQFDDIYDFLGQGTFANVFKAKCVKDVGEARQGQEVALKLIDQRELKSEKMARDVINEVEILRQIKHRNCVRLLESFQTQHYVVLVMDLVRGEELFKVLRETDFTEAMVRDVMFQIMGALAHLHRDLCIVHRDIKPENVLLTKRDDSSFHVTLVDFGLARTIGRRPSRRRITGRAFIPLPQLAPLPPRNPSMDSVDSASDSPLTSTPCGTLRFAAPETVKVINRSERLNTTRDLLPRVDVYACGVIMYIMLCGCLPFHDFTNKVSLYHEMEKGPSFDSQSWHSVSQEAVDLTQALLINDPKKRPHALEALQFPWFQQSTACRDQFGECQRIKVNEIVGQRDYMTKAFDALRPPEVLYEPIDDHGVVPAGRCISIPFAPQVKSKPSSYFDFQ